MIFNLTAREWPLALSDLFLPRQCIVCGKPLALRERHICVGCLADMPRTFFSGQRRNQMADRFNALIQRDLDSAIMVPYSYATALFFYRAGTGYRNITKRLKYHADIGTGRFFSGMLGKEMALSPLYKDVDTIIPVPLHWSRRWSRGYNQAEVIARTLASSLEAEVRLDILYRPGRTRSQARLKIEEKAANVEGAFKMRKGAKLPTGSHILLVDDVFTTGATLHSCYKALEEELGSKTRISVATLAYVGF